MDKQILILNPHYKRPHLARFNNPKHKKKVVKMAKRRRHSRRKAQLVIIKARRRAKRNPLFGRHRISMKWTKRGWKSKSKKLGRRRPVRINPFRGSNRVIDKQLLIQGLSVAVGLYGGVQVQKWLNRQPAVSPNMLKYTGLANIALGTLLALKAKKSTIKSAGVGIVASGIWDLISKNLTGVGLTPLVGLDVSGEEELLGYTNDELLGENEVVDVNGLDVSGEEVVDGVEVIDGDENETFGSDW